MATHLIIDGYNVLGVRSAGPSCGRPPSEFAREQLLRDLAGYRQRKGHAITVVFDGWREGLGVERHEHRSGVEVIYSRRGERADQVIQRLAQAYGRDCAVVSSDREVADFARAHGAFVIGAGEFVARLATPVASPAVPALKGRAVGEEDLPRRNPDKKGNPHKLPKALRRRNRQLRKF
jgi:predicted RNA-binding protein with PIN domain